MVKIVGDNSGLIRAAVRRLFSKLPGWLRMPLIGKPLQRESTEIPDQLCQRDIYKVFYLLLRQAGGKVAMFQETIDNVDDDFVKDFVFVKENSLNGLGPGWVIGLQSCETERVTRIRKRSRKRSAKRLANRKNNIKLKTGLPETAPTKSE